MPYHAWSMEVDSNFFFMSGEHVLLESCAMPEPEELKLPSVADVREIKTDSSDSLSEVNNRKLPCAKVKKSVKVKKTGKIKIVYACDICGRCFTLPNSLTNHQHVCKALACFYCKRKFLLPCYARRHEKKCPRNKMAINFLLNPLLRQYK